MHYFSPLRYPGGKGKLAPFLKQLFRHNNLCDGTYIEPYAGGAAVALTLLLEGYAWEIVINDIDPLIYAFWWSMLNDTETLSRKIKDTPVTMQVWHEQKLVHDYPEQHSKTDVGFATFFLNRTNRSGVLKGGVIGGKDQSSKYKIDARFNKEDLITRINRIALYKDRIKLFNLDAIEFINRISNELSSNSILYMDPPYYRKGEGLYENHYEHEDHVHISRYIRENISTNWLLTYDNVPIIKKLYEDFRFFEYSLSYSASRHYSGSELMIFSNQLSIPHINNPTKVDFPNA